MRPEKLSAVPRFAGCAWWQTVHDTPSAASGDATISSIAGVSRPSSRACWLSIGAWQRRHRLSISCLRCGSASISVAICARQYGSRNEFAIIVALHVPTGDTSSPVAVFIARARGLAEWHTAQRSAGRNAPQRTSPCAPWVVDCASGAEELAAAGAAGGASDSPVTLHATIRPRETSGTEKAGLRSMRGA